VLLGGFGPGGIRSRSFYKRRHSDVERRNGGKTRASSLEHKELLGAPPSY